MTPDQAGGERTPQTTVRNGGRLLVDQLLGLRGDEQLQAEPDAGGHPDFAPARMRDGQGRRWQVLDLDALTQHPQFLRIVLN